MIRKEMSPEDAQLKLETMCSRAEYSRAEVMRKLASWGVGRSSSQRVVDELVEGDFVNDERFARAFVREKIEYSKWGERKVAAALRSKGIAPDLIREALEEVDVETIERIARQLIVAKGAQVQSPESYEGMAKIARFMASRGFSSSLVFRILREPGLWDGGE